MADDPAKQRIIAHMNKEHSRELSHYLRHLCGLSPSAAAANPTLVDITTQGMLISASGQQHKIPFTPPLESLRDARTRLVAMDADARAALNIGDVVVDGWQPPRLDANGVLAGFLWVYFVIGAALWTPSTRDFVTTQLMPRVVGDPVIRGYLVAGIRYSFWPVVSIHVVETAMLERTRLQKYGVQRFSAPWLLWLVSFFVEGVAAMWRFDRVVESKRKLKNH
jgi:hypothetical protein